MNSALFICIISLSMFIIGENTANLACKIQLYQLGDSISDTKNFVEINPTFLTTRLPYGETFPGRPSGRASNGRLIIDYIAAGLGLPLLNAYLDKNASFTNGVNFAVGGATAQNSHYFAGIGVSLPPTPGYSSGAQLKWFLQYLASICSTSQSGSCADKLRKSLFIVGEFGINDFNDQLLQGRNITQIFTTVPYINQAIIRSIKKLIQAGASRLLVPGNFALGCFPVFIAASPSNDPNSYDDLGCLKSANELATYQNDDLQTKLSALRIQYPGVDITYVDYYNAFLSVFRAASSLGFDPTKLLQPCCGSYASKFNVSSPDFCGNPGVPLCPNPQQYISWDGIHPTQETYRRISEIVIPQSVLPAALPICL